MTFSLYPRPLFGGAISFLLYTVLPAGFVGFLPVELVRAPSLGLLLTVLGSGAALWIAARARRLPRAGCAATSRAAASAR